jgi:hypothetical protein
VADVLREDPRYQFNAIETATELPAYWIWGRGNDEAERMKPSIKAVCSVQSRLRPEHDRNPSRAHVLSQWLNVYLVEMNGSSASQSLALAANRVQHERVATVAITAGRLVALAFALTSSENARLVESTAKLDRFREPLSDVLATAMS